MAGGRVRDTTMRGLSAVAGGGVTVGVASVIPCAGRATAPATSSPDLPQRDVHGPVVAAQFGELPGAVERVDDPHPLGGEPDGVVGALLGQHRVAGPLGSQRLHQEVVGSLVPRGLPLGPAGVGELGTYLEQQLARVGRQAGGNLVVAHR